jgi:hypothetical protein
MSSSPAVLLYGNDDFAIQRRLGVGAIFPDAQRRHEHRLPDARMSEDDSTTPSTRRFSPTGGSSLANPPLITLQARLSSRTSWRQL